MREFAGEGRFGWIRDRWKMKSSLPSADRRHLRQMRSNLSRPGRLSATVRAGKADPPGRLSVECVAGDHVFTVALRRAEANWQITAAGKGATAKRVLRNTLIGDSTLVSEPHEHHVLDEATLSTTPRDLEAMLVRHVARLDLQLHSMPSELNRLTELPPDCIPTYWWDVKANFGDAIGPWLIQMITGKTPINMKRTQIAKPTLYTAGSVFGHIDSPGSTVWGSGLIDKIADNARSKFEANRPATILAVRGKLTRRELVEKLGWDVPEVLGDPAVLLPRWYAPKPANRVSGRVAVVPHYVHRPLFDVDEQRSLYSVDVRQDPATVIDEIAGARTCISTSLHGVIVAHVYGVPWLWLRITDSPLHGDDFKFEDFFSCLARTEVASRDVSTTDVGDLDFCRLARLCRLPTTTADFDRLANAFPASHL